MWLAVGVAARAGPHQAQQGPGDQRSVYRYEKEGKWNHAPAYRYNNELLTFDTYNRLNRLGRKGQHTRTKRQVSPRNTIYTPNNVERSRCCRKMLRSSSTAILAGVDGRVAIFIVPCTGTYTWSNIAIYYPVVEECLPCRRNK